MEVSGHGGNLALPVRAHGVREMSTLSGGHVFPLYVGAVHAEPPMPLCDVRHEQSAVFAAEAVAELERRPGLAVLTAGPGGRRSRDHRPRSRSCWATAPPASP